MADVGARAPAWKRFLAPILDFLMVFIVGGNIISALVGTSTPEGFVLPTIPALALIAIIIAYFYIGRRVAGGTLWDRFFGIVRPQPVP